MNRKHKGRTVAKNYAAAVESLRKAAKSSGLTVLKVKKVKKGVYEYKVRKRR